MTDIEAKRAAFKEERQKKKRQQVLVAVAILLAGLGGIIGATKWMSRAVPTVGPPNYADQLALVLPLVELNNLDGEWIGVTGESWAGLSDPARATADCGDALARIEEELAAAGTLALLSPDGAPVVECGSQ